VVIRHLQAEHAKPYKSSYSDCLMVGLTLACQLGGNNVVSKYRGKYKTLKQSAVVMRRMGFTSLKELLAADFDPIAPAQCRFGDLAVVLNNGLEHVGVCVGENFSVKTQEGAVMYPLSAVTAGYRI